MKKIYRTIALIINLNIIAITFYLIYLNIILPDNYNCFIGTDAQINNIKYVTMDIKNKKTKDPEMQVSNLKLNNCTELQNSKTEQYAYQHNENCEALIKAYNVLPVKQVDINFIKPIEIYPCGQPFGIKMFTKGVMLVGMGEVCKGTIPCKDAGLKLGDIILSINNIPVYTNEEIGDIINKSNGEDISIRVNRNNIEKVFKLTPQKSTMQNCYKAGMWVRNSTAGVGTLTFYTDNGNFVGLGHPVCDVDTGEMMPLLSGEIIDVKIDGINKAKTGYPGELKGTFSNEKNVGLLTQNTFTGIYGKITDLSFLEKQSKMPVAMMQEIKEGPAKILTTIDENGPRYFDISIEKINYNNINPCKNMVVKITDKKLITKTGGIVQGMSGSPIIQNGKVIGAITHVFVNQPLKGYGIFAENMIKNIT